MMTCSQPSIMAASVLAKVARDAHMVQLDAEHPGCGCVEPLDPAVGNYADFNANPALYAGAGNRTRFSTHETLLAGTGTAGSLLPPHEYHTIRNPKDDAIAISLHVYQKAMGECSTFAPLGEGWYERGKRQRDHLAASEVLLGHALQHDPAPEQHLAEAEVADRRQRRRRDAIVDAGDARRDRRGHDPLAAVAWRWSHLPELA